MKYSLTASFAFAAGALAASIRRDTCSFTLTSSGGQSSIVGQLEDGQLRILGDHPTAHFTITDGTTTDSEGRPCYLTSEANQYQCDTGMAATGGFAIGANGTYSHSGSSVFYACPSSDIDYNIYTTPVAGQSKCVEVGLTASGCFAPAPAPAPASSSSSVQMSTPTSVEVPVAVATTTEQQACAASTITVSSPAETVYVTSSVIETAPGQTIYETMTVEETAPAQTVVVTETAPGQTFHETQVQQETLPAQTVYITQTQEETAPAQTVYVTQTQQETLPAQTVHITQTQQETLPAQTVYITQTQQETLPAQTTTSVVAPTASSTESCPTNLDGAYTSPNLIVPVSSGSPDTAYGTSYNGVVNSTVSTLFNFDIPSSYASKTCSLVFLFPTQDMLETSSYTFSGTGAIDFKQLTTTVTTSSTYNSVGATETDFGSKSITPGSWTVVDTFECPAGEAVSYEMSNGGSNTDLWFFEDYNPSPIGLFITTC